MMDNINNLNNLAPLPSTQPLADPSVQKGGSVQKSKDVKSLSSSKVNAVFFPKTPTSFDSPGNFTVTRAHMNDSLLQELDQLLQNQAEQIEMEFNELNNQEKDKELIDAILGIEGWGYGVLNFATDKTKSGVDFLENVLPKNILEKISTAQKWAKLGGIASLGGTLLSALDVGAQGVAFFCKIKILTQSKEFFKTYKANYAQQLASEQKGLNASEQKEVALSSKHKNIQKAINEWELQIAIEEKALKEEKFQFGLAVTSQTLILLNKPLVYIPKELVLKPLKTVVTGIAWAVSSAVSGIEIIAGIIELKETSKNSDTLNKWMQSYQNWQKEHLPQFEITKQGARRVGFTPHQPVILSDAEHKNLLLASIKTKPLAHARNKLKECGIELPSTITKKSTLITYLKSQPHLIQTYIHFQRQLENLNNIIYTSENLLAKRKAISDKKILLLKSRFNSVEPQIRQWKNQAFVRDMQQLTKILQNPLCTFDQVEGLLNKWKILDSTILTQNPQLTVAFEKFKKVKLQAMTSLSEDQQQLLDVLNTWKNQADTLNQYFEKWYEIQDKESLIKDYIDHQETIENTTKNALKQMVQQKHELENRFQSFKLTKSRVLFTVATISFTANVVLAILGLLTLPVGGAGAILLGLSIGSTILSVGFLAAGSIHSRRHKPHTTKEMTLLFQIKMAWTKLRTAINTYSHRSKEKKLIEIAKILHRLHQSPTKKSNQSTNPEYQKALINYQQAKLNFEASQQKVDYWTKRLKKFEDQITRAQWKDFSQYANLPQESSFDTLTAFQEAFRACDLRLLSSEAQSLLEVQLGINLENLQAQMKKDPEGVKNSLQEFFALGDAGLIDFIKNQKARMKKGLLKFNLA